MAEMNGYIKLHRQLIDSPVFQNEKLLKVWIWCLLKASHTAHEEIVGLQKVYLEPGQFVFGSIKSAEVLDMPRTTFNRCMDALKKFEMLDIKATNKFSIATVENWGKFQAIPQAFGQQEDNRWTTNGQQTDTNKNDKNEKKDKNNIYIGVPDEILPAFMEFVKMRNKIKKPITSQQTVTRIVNKLNKLGHDTQERINILNQSTDNCWRDVYPLKEKTAQATTLDDSYEMMGEWANG